MKTDGRFAEVQYCKNWREDAKRRDFTFNSIYSNLNGELFDPFNGKKDLLNGWVKFIGNPATRIKEDYLRILRYIRFFLIYSKNNHSEESRHNADEDRVHRAIQKCGLSFRTQPKG